MQETLETPRLLLRPPLPVDAPALSLLDQDERVRQFLGGALSSQHAETRASDIVRHWQNFGRGLWVVCAKETSEQIGLCALGLFEEEVEVSYKLFPAYWGRGYATEAASACLSYGFQTLHLQQILGVTQETNRSSQRVLEKLGMRHVGNLEKWNALQRVYVLTRDEWLTLQEAMR